MKYGNPSVEYSFATSLKADPIKGLLRNCGLPYEDIDPHLRHFIVAKSDDDLIGVIGMEGYGKIGLLRSLAVAEAYRGRGVAKALYARILAHAHLQGVGELFLLTNTAEGFFSKIGFHKTIRDSVPESIKTTKEFQSLCPSTTVCMAKRIDKQLGEHE